MKRFILFLLITVGIGGCAAKEKQRQKLEPSKVNDGSYYSLSRGEGFVQEGTASWYGEEFHGRKTASGERYNMYEKTAAHRTLPFGTHVKVKNLSNQREVVVRINDRGPFAKGRIIDLSYGAASEIGLIGVGVARVRLVALSKGVNEFAPNPMAEAKDSKRRKFTVQVGAFENEDTARRLAERLRVIFDKVHITTYKPPRGKTLYRVRIPTAEDLTEARRIVKRLKYLGFSEAFIVTL